MSDLISRQGVIAEWKNDFKEYINALDIPRDDYKGIIEYIDELPSAQLEQRWIPCSERLPAIGKPVLISALMPLCVMVYIGYLSDDVWFCDRLFFRSDEVVAWMPLPEPYEAESEG